MPPAKLDHAKPIAIEGHTVGHTINKRICTTAVFEEGGGKRVAQFSGKNRAECTKKVIVWAEAKKLTIANIDGVRFSPSKAVQEKEQAEKLRKAQAAATLSPDDLAGGIAPNTEELAKIEAEAAAAAKKEAAEAAKAKAKEDAEVAAQAKAEAADAAKSK